MSALPFAKIGKKPQIDNGSESADQRTNKRSHLFPIHLQNKYRDNGTLRKLSDLAVTCSVPSLAFENPKAAGTFLHLTKDVMKQIYYGSNGNKSQKIDLFLPMNVGEDEMKGLVLFVVS